MVADHAGNIGVLNGLRAADPLLVADEVGRGWYEQFKAAQAKPAGNGKANTKAAGTSKAKVAGTSKANAPAKRTSAVPRKVAATRLENKTFTRSVWQRNCDVADRLNQPGVFTALIGYEWTPHPKGNNLHRVLIFRDGADKAARVLPFSASDSVDVEDLWKSTWTPMRSRPVAPFWRFRTTRTCRTGSCSP